MVRPSRQPEAADGRPAWPEPGNVVLTGFMGTGKTTVGRLLAERLGYEFVDTDALIEGRHGPIHRIFADRGEAAFRAIERSVARELAGRQGLVVSTGGRMMLDPENEQLLGTSGPVYCLMASPAEILRRVLADRSVTERPLLAGDDPARRIAELLAEREPGYRRYPQVDTEDRSPEEIVADLVGRLAAATMDRR